MLRMSRKRMFWNDPLVENRGSKLSPVSTLSRNTKTAKLKKNTGFLIRDLKKILETKRLKTSIIYTLYSFMDDCQRDCHATVREE